MQSVKQKRMENGKTPFFTILWAVFLLGCQETSPNGLRSSTALRSLTTVENERDEIFSLLAYAIVLKDWQTKGPDQRGHNIGAILVNEKQEVVFWARNCSYRERNGTQHAEIRLMQGFL